MDKVMLIAGLYLIVVYVILHAKVEYLCSRLKKIEADQEKLAKKLDELINEDVIDIRIKLSDILSEYYQQYSDLQTQYNEKLLIVRNYTDNNMKKIQETFSKYLKHRPTPNIIN